MAFSAIRHRLLLSLALAQGPLKLPLLTRRSHVSMETAERLANELREAALLTYSGWDGWSLRPGVVVSEKGYVGYLVPLDLTPKPYGRLVALESGR